MSDYSISDFCEVLDDIKAELIKANLALEILSDVIVQTFQDSDQHRQRHDKLASMVTRRPQGKRQRKTAGG